MSVTIPSNPSAELQTALKWIDGFNRWDLDYLLSVFADDYTHHILPNSLGIKPRNKEEFREYMASSVMPMFNSFKVTLHEIIESPGKVFFHASSKGTSSTGFPYANEYCLVLHLTTQVDGPPKVSFVKEYVDSKLAVEFFAAERQRQAAKQQASDNTAA